jgi:hypothetical protein
MRGLALVTVLLALHFALAPQGLGLALGLAAAAPQRAGIPGLPVAFAVAP